MAMASDASLTVGGAKVRRRVAAAVLLIACLPLHAGAGLLDDDEARKAIVALGTKVDTRLRDIDTQMRDLRARIDTKGDKTLCLASGSGLTFRHDLCCNSRFHHASNFGLLELYC